MPKAGSGSSSGASSGAPGPEASATGPARLLGSLRQEEALLGQREQLAERAPAVPRRRCRPLLPVTRRSPGRARPAHRAGDGGDGVEGDPADEDPQAAEEPPLRLGQEVVAPAHRRLQAALPRRPVRRLGGQQLQAVAQPPRSAGSESTSRRAAASSNARGRPSSCTASWATSGGVPRRVGEVGAAAPAPGRRRAPPTGRPAARPAAAAPRAGRGPAAGRRAASAPSAAAGGRGWSPAASGAGRPPGGRRAGRPRAAPARSCRAPRADPAPLRERVDQALRQGPAAGIQEAQRPRDRAEHQGGFADGGEIDQHDATSEAVGDAGQLRAAVSARRVLPTPAGPVSVSRRTSPPRSSPAIRSSSCARSTSGVG